MAQQFKFSHKRGIVPAKPMTQDEAKQEMLEAYKNYLAYAYDPYSHTYGIDVLEDIEEDIENAFCDVKDEIAADIEHNQREEQKILAQLQMAQR